MSALFSSNDSSRARLKVTEKAIELTLIWKTFKTAEDWKLLLHRLPPNTNYIRNEEYRFLNRAINPLG